MTTNILDRVWDGAGETWHWLRGVVLGEWDDHRTVSQIVTDALAGFVPGLGSIITLRDLLAVIVRLAKHPEKREQIEEWILLVAMLLPLILTALGALAVGIGALVGAELGGFLRALTLTLVKEGGVALKALVEFFQHHGYGDVVKALRQVKFAKYKDALITGLGEQLDKLIALVRSFEKRLRSLHPESLPTWLPGRDKLVYALDHCPVLIKQLDDVRKAALSMIPKTLIELDRRLGALLAGDIKAATQTTHAIATGQEAPKVAKLESPPAAKDGNTAPTLHNPKQPEPGNTRRLAERRTVALAGKREYAIVNEVGRPVGAKPYKDGITKFDYPALELDKWDMVQGKVQEGWPNMHKEYAPRRYSTDYANFSGELHAETVTAGSKTTFKRIVSHDAEGMDKGPYYNRELPIDGEDMRSASAIKEGWNKNGQYVELRIPAIGDPIWKELHALQEKAAGVPVPFKEELKFWEGPASAQVYQKELADGTRATDSWYLAGGKPQQFFDRDQMNLLKERGFVGPRKATNFPDFNAQIGNIVPKNGPFLEVVPLTEAMPHPSSK